ncbi:hypothetical protein ABD86_13090 [Paenibacillus alvei]|nr:hypothetical protein [Paenibacillus alvei]MBG9744825.1 hypothetical protein [Paenibacillus alvei]
MFFVYWIGYTNLDGKIKANRMRAIRQRADLLCPDIDAHLLMSLRDKWFSFTRMEYHEQLLQMSTN